jgi:hypothetical protein
MYPWFVSQQAAAIFSLLAAGDSGLYTMNLFIPI